MMATIDAVNLPLTTIFNVRGDRVVMVARRPLPPPRPSDTPSRPKADSPAAR
jgi:hypothetical protein